MLLYSVFPSGQYAQPIAKDFTAQLFRLGTLSSGLLSKANDLSFACGSKVRMTIFTHLTATDSHRSFTCFSVQQVYYTTMEYGIQTSLIQKDHPEKRNLPFGAIVHHAAAFGQFFHINAIGRQAGKSQIRIAAGGIFPNGAAVTEIASAGTCHKAVDVLSPQVLHQAD